MISVPGHNYLYKRGSRYYFRRKIPKEYREHFTGKTYCRSLKTSLFSEAKARCTQKAAQFDQKLENLKEIIGSVTAKEEEQVGEKTLTRSLIDRMINNMEFDYFRENEDYFLKVYQSSEKYEQEEIIDSFREMETEFYYDTKTGNYFNSQQTVKSLLKNEQIQLDTKHPLWKSLVHKVAVLERDRAKDFLRLTNDRDRILEEKVKITPPVYQFLPDAIAKFSELKKHGWKGRTIIRKKEQLDLLIKYFGEKELSELTLIECEEYISFLSVFPANLRKHYPIETYSFDAACQKGKEDKRKVIAIATQEQYARTFHQFLKWCKKTKLIDFDPDVEIKKDKTPGYKKRPPYSKQDYNIFIKDDFFITSDQVLLEGHSYQTRYWSVIIATLTGMRLGEILTLTVDDVIYKDGFPFFDLKEKLIEEGGHETTSLKTSNSFRAAPVHPLLINIGILKLIENRKKENLRQLFPDIDFRVGEPGDAIGKWFKRLNRKYFGKSTKYTFHCLRHLFRDELRRNRIWDDIGRIASGWSSNSTSDNYGLISEAYSPKEIYEEIAKMKFDGLSLHHLHKHNVIISDKPLK